MKKLFLCFLVMTGFVLASQAQKGSVLVYGNFNVSTQEDPLYNKTTNFGIFPGIGYQFTNHWTAGVTGGYAQSKYKPAVGAEAKSSNYAAGIFGRYTHPLGSIFSIYGQADVLYRGRKTMADAKFSGFGVNLTPAVQLNVSNGFALNFGFGSINFNNDRQKDNRPTTSFGISFGQQVSIGISKNFSRKK